MESHFPPHTPSRSRERVGCLIAEGGGTPRGPPIPTVASTYMPREAAAGHSGNASHTCSSCVPPSPPPQVPGSSPAARGSPPQLQRSAARTLSLTSPLTSVVAPTIAAVAVSAAGAAMAGRGGRGLDGLTPSPSTSSADYRSRQLQDPPEHVLCLSPHASGTERSAGTEAAGESAWLRSDPRTPTPQKAASWLRFQEGDVDGGDALGRGLGGRRGDDVEYLTELLPMDGADLDEVLLCSPGDGDDARYLGTASSRNYAALIAAVEGESEGRSRVCAGPARGGLPGLAIYRSPSAQVLSRAALHMRSPATASPVGSTAPPTRPAALAGGTSSSYESEQYRRAVARTLGLPTSRATRGVFTYEAPPPVAQPVLRVSGARAPSASTPQPHPALPPHAAMTSPSPERPVCRSEGGACDPCATPPRPSSPAALSTPVRERPGGAVGGRGCRPCARGEGLSAPLPPVPVGQRDGSSPIDTPAEAGAATPRRTHSRARAESRRGSGYVVGSPTSSLTGVDEGLVLAVGGGVGARFSVRAVPPAMTGLAPAVLRTPVRHSDNDLYTAAPSDWSPLGPLASVATSHGAGLLGRMTGRLGWGGGRELLASPSVRASPLGVHVSGRAGGWVSAGGASAEAAAVGATTPPIPSAADGSTHPRLAYSHGGGGAAGLVSPPVPVPPTVTIRGGTGGGGGAPRPFTVERKLNINSLVLRAHQSPLHWGCFGLLVALRDGVHVLSTDVMTGRERVVRLYVTGRTAGPAGDDDDDEDAASGAGAGVTVVTSTRFLGEQDGAAGVAACRPGGQGTDRGGAAESAHEGAMAYVALGLSSGAVIVHGYRLCTRTSAAFRARHPPPRVLHRPYDAVVGISPPPTTPLPLYAHPDLAGELVCEYAFPGDGSAVSAVHVVGSTLYVGTMAGRLSLYDLRHIARSAGGGPRSTRGVCSAEAGSSPSCSPVSMPPTPPRPVWVPPQHRMRTQPQPQPQQWVRAPPSTTGPMAVSPYALPASTVSLTPGSTAPASQRPPLHSPPSLAALVASNRLHSSATRAEAARVASERSEAEEAAAGEGRGPAAALKYLDSSTHTTSSSSGGGGGGGGVSAGDDAQGMHSTHLDTSPTRYTPPTPTSTATATMAGGSPSGHGEVTDLREVGRALARLAAESPPVHVMVGESIYGIAATLDRDRVAVGTTRRLLVYHARQLRDCAAPSEPARAAAAGETAGGGVCSPVGSLSSPTPLVIMRNAARPVRAFDWLRQPYPHGEELAGEPRATACTHVDPAAALSDGLGPVLGSSSYGHPSRVLAGGGAGVAATGRSPVARVRGGSGSGGATASPLLVFAGGRTGAELCVFSLAAQRVVSRRAVGCPIHMLRCSPHSAEVVVCRQVAEGRDLRSYWRVAGLARAAEGLAGLPTAVPAPSLAATGAGGPSPAAAERSRTPSPAAMAVRSPTTTLTSAMDTASLQLFELTFPDARGGGGAEGEAGNDARLAFDESSDSDGDGGEGLDEEEWAISAEVCRCSGSSPYRGPADSRAPSKLSRGRAPDLGRTRTPDASRDGALRAAAAAMLTPARSARPVGVSAGGTGGGSRVGRTGAPVIRLRGYSESGAARGVGPEDVVYAAFSPDGARLATAGPSAAMERHATVWDPLRLGDDARQGRVAIAAAAAAYAFSARQGTVAERSPRVLVMPAWREVQQGSRAGGAGDVRSPQPMLPPTTPDFAAHSILR